MHIFLTNDDGVAGEGLTVLHRVLLERGHRVSVVAPDRERSASSQSLTITRPLRVRQVEATVHAVDGTPADCVHLGILNLVQSRPDLLISGINRGLNVGDNIYYSGTVAAAQEGLLLGIPSMAVSRKYWEPSDQELDAAAKKTEALARWWCERTDWADRCLLNVNFPVQGAKGIRLTRQGKRTSHTPARPEKDPMGRAFFWGWVNDDGFLADPHADYQAVREGFISLTPLRVPRTEEDALEALSRIPLPR